MVSSDTLNTYLNQLLEADRFSDGCPNGLQVQGRTQIQRVITGVTASHALITKAIELKADAVLVHHGYFWKNENPSIVGIKYHRIKALLDHDISLFAYHLPLDAHRIYGNNALLCQALGARVVETFGDQNVGFMAQFDEAKSLDDLMTVIYDKINKRAFVAGNIKDKNISKIAVCSGGGQSFFQSAVSQSADVFLTGEIAEHNVHEAEESDVCYIAAGHHATERFGVRALGEHLREQFNIEVQFVDIDSGV